MKQLDLAKRAYMDGCSAAGLVIPSDAWEGIFQFSIAGYLGREELNRPLSLQETHDVSDYMHRLGRLMRQVPPTLCYGKRAAAVAVPPECDPLQATPHLSAMLDVMDGDGHDTRMVRAEIDRLKMRITYLVTHLRAAKYQTDAAIAGILATLPAINDAVSSLPQIF